MASKELLQTSDSFSDPAKYLRFSSIRRRSLKTRQNTNLPLTQHSRKNKIGVEDSKTNGKLTSRSSWTKWLVVVRKEARRLTLDPTVYFKNRFDLGNPANVPAPSSEPNYGPFAHLEAT